MKIKKKTLIYILLVMAIGFLASNYEPAPEVTSIIITAETEIIDNKVLQRYQVGNNEICQTDCKLYSTQNDVEYVAAIVRVWGQCNCRVIG
jgi:hypothetical protein